MLSEFGEFTCDFVVKGQQLILTQEFKTREAVIPPKDYSEVQKFFASANEMQDQAVVLVKN